MTAPALRKADAAVIKGLRKAKSGTAKITTEVRNGIVDFAKKTIDKTKQTKKIKKPSDPYSPDWDEWYKQNPNHPESVYIV